MHPSPLLPCPVCRTPRTPTDEPPSSSGCCPRADTARAQRGGGGGAASVPRPPPPRSPCGPIYLTYLPIPSRGERSTAAIRQFLTLWLSSTALQRTQFSWRGAPPGPPLRPTQCPKPPAPPSVAPCAPPDLLPCPRSPPPVAAVACPPFYENRTQTPVPAHFRGRPRRLPRLSPIPPSELNASTLSLGRPAAGLTCAHTACSRASAAPTSILTPHTHCPRPRCLPPPALQLFPGAPAIWRRAPVPR